MKHSFLIICPDRFIYGRGKTIAEAANVCLKGAGRKSDKAVVQLFQHPTEDPAPAVLNILQVEYAAGSTKMDIGTFTLGQCLNSSKLDNAKASDRIVSCQRTGTKIYENSGTE